MKGLNHPNIGEEGQGAGSEATSTWEGVRGSGV
jgi:hypothetical protein